MDKSTPNAARMYDYFLDGFHNTAIDRAAADIAIKLAPITKYSVRANRQALQRFVKTAHEYGIVQILDLGSGLPTRGNVHEVMKRLNPDATIAYVDHDPTVVTYASNILKKNKVDGVICVEGDLTDMPAIFENNQVRDLIDFSWPVAVLMCSVLHFIVDDNEVSQIMKYIHKNIVSGSVVGITHGTHEGFSPEVVEKLSALYAKTTTPGTTRTRKELKRLFSGFEVLEPGIVDCPQWRPDTAQPPIGGPFAHYGVYAAMGVKS